MTRTSALLHPSSAAQLALRALAGQGEHGVISQLAGEYGVPRKQVYDIRDHGEQALLQAFTPTVATERHTFTMTVAPADIKRTIVALRTEGPNSIRDIGTLLMDIYGVDWSYGKIQGVLVEAEQRAKAHLKGVALSGIKNIALDEMFSQGRPVFAGIDLDTQYLFQLEVHDNRKGDEWAGALGDLRDKQSLRPECTVKDAGTGLASGVGQVWPGAEQREDLFHAVYYMGKEAYHLERGAYRAIKMVEDLVTKRRRAGTETERRSLGQASRQAVERMDEAIVRYDRFESLRREADRVLQLAERGSGRLRTSAEVAEALTRIATEMSTLGTKRIRAVAKYLKNRAPGLARYLDALGQRVARIAEDVGTELVEAVVRAYQASLEASRGGPRWDRKARAQELHAAAANLCSMEARDDDRLLQALGKVLPVLAQRNRASSAIENLNSVLRPYLVVQKHAQNGFLNLFRFHWNTRKRQWGRWKGTSAHEQLTGEKIDDWLTVLGFPPSVATNKSA